MRSSLASSRERVSDAFPVQRGAPDAPHIANGIYASSMAALYEVAGIRTVDRGLLRWLARGPFAKRRVAEFGALTGRSAEWLNETGDVAAWAFDGVRGGKFGVGTGAT